MRTQLENFKGRKFVGVAELAATVERILETSNAQQERGTVRDYPDERTIRFYLSEGLIPASSEKQGTASVFGYLHLLALLVVKKLQSESLPIRKIREIISGRTEKELEKILGVETKENNQDKSKNTTKNEAQQFLETLLLESSLPMRERDEKPAFSRLSPSSPVRRQRTGKHQQAQKWKRFEIAPGLELNLEENFKTSSGLQELELLETIRQIIQSAK